MWIPWTDRYEEFAPIVALHRLHLFHPTQIEAFLKDKIDVRQPPFDDLTINDDEFGQIDLWGLTIAQKRAYIGGMQLSNPLHRRSYLDKYGFIESDIKRSVTHQSGIRRTVYARGHRNTYSGQAFITYWFFYLENFVPSTRDDDKISDQLEKNPDHWASHQGDWEMISIEFEDHEADPKGAYFSQHTHEGFEPWGSANMEIIHSAIGQHIRVLPALGSHANYFKETIENLPGPYWDLASPDDPFSPEAIEPDTSKSYRLIGLDPTIHTWLRFPGRWGKSHWGEAGQAPTGPLMKADRLPFKLWADQHHLT